MTADRQEVSNPRREQPDPRVVKGIGTTAMPESESSDAWKTEILSVTEVALNEAEQESLFEFLTGEDEAAMQAIRDRIAAELRERDPRMPTSGRPSPLGLSSPGWLLLSQASGYLPGRTVPPRSLAQIEANLAKRFAVSNTPFGVGAVTAFKKLFVGVDPAETAAVPAKVVEAGEQVLADTSEAIKIDREIEVEPMSDEKTPSPTPEEAPLAGAAELKPAWRQTYPLTQKEIARGVYLDKHALAARSGLSLERIEAIMQRVRKTPEFYGTEKPKNMRSSYANEQADHYSGKALSLYWAAIERALAAQEARDADKAE